MQQVLIKLVVNAIALWVAVLVVDGIVVSGRTNGAKILTVLVVAAIFGLVNAIIKPVVKFLAIPLYILTLGLITFVINALMLLITSGIADVLNVPFRVDGFVAGLLGGLVISFVNFLLNLLLRDVEERR
jgi:putative membrane protein